MLAWRICRAPFAGLTGEGARLYGGRWNSAGHAVVYAASTAALAVLEVRVHLDLPLDLLPDDYVLVTIDMDDLPLEDVAEAPAVPQAFGDAWLKEGRTALLRVPSFIVPESTNLLLNVAHPASSVARVVGTRPFDFDRRLWFPLP